MEDSNQQFQELLAHLVVRVNKMLEKQQDILPLSLVLDIHGNVEVAVGLAEMQDQVPAIINAMQQALIKRVAEGGVQATCIAYPDYRDGAVVALLENHENFCAIVTVPVVADSWSLDTEHMEVKDGSVYIFPVMH